MKKIRVKRKAVPDEIARFGEKKALFRCAADYSPSRIGDYWDVFVVRYEGKDYFVVMIGNKVKECMPL